MGLSWRPEWGRGAWSWGQDRALPVMGVVVLGLRWNTALPEGLTRDHLAPPWRV